MSIVEKQEVGKATCVFLYDEHRKMVKVMIKSGHYKNASECIRASIERDFKDKLGDPTEELKRVKTKLKEVEKELEERVGDTDDILNNLVSKYKERKKSMPAKSMGKYEKFSKNWIETHIDDANIAFPGKNVDEVYEELEKLMKV